MKKLKCINTTQQITDFIEKLQYVRNEGELFSTVGTSVLEFKDTSDKNSALIGMKNILSEFQIINASTPSPDELIQFLQQFIVQKELFKEKINEEKKNLAIYGGRHTAEYLEVEFRNVELNGSLLIRPNVHDYDLFNHFKQCGSSLVLVDKKEVLLCTENARNEIKIPMKYFLKGEIAERVKWDFDEKLKMYYKKLQEFLVGLQQKIKDCIDDDDISISPIEDFFCSEIPTAISKLFQIVAVYKTTGEGKDKVKWLDHFEAKPKKFCEDFSEIFYYVLQNWPKFTGRIRGQSEFLAWTNDRLEVASNYFELPKEKVTTCPETWNKFMTEKFGDSNHLRLRFETYLGMCLDASNRCQQYLIISDIGGTGKDFFSKAIRAYLPKNTFSDVELSMFEESSRFGLSGIEVWKSHISLIHEISKNSKNLMSPKAKQFFGQNNMQLEIKNGGTVDWNPLNHKTIIFSNEKIAIKEPANRRRAIPITFNGKLNWTQEFEDKIYSETGDFLKYCYYIYLNNQMVKNGQYIVLSEEDEKKYLNGELDVNSENWEKLSKSAFSEECLKDYYNTDEYTETDEALDIFEPICEDLFKFEDPEAFVTSTELVSAIKEHIANNRTLVSYFGAKLMGNEIELNLYGQNTPWYKFINYLRDKKDVFKKKKNVNGKTCNCYMGMAIKNILEQLATTNNSMNGNCGNSGNSFFEDDSDQNSEDSSTSCSNKIDYVADYEDEFFKNYKKNQE